MSTYTQRLTDLKSKATIDLSKLIGKYGIECKSVQCQCLRIEDDNLKYNLEGGRYSVEITSNLLIDNSGYQFNHCTLEDEQFFEIVDHLIEKHDGIENTTTIAQHEVGYYLRDFESNYLDFIPESDMEHIEKQILDGIHTGEICASIYVNESDEETTEFNGWWNIK